MEKKNSVFDASNGAVCFTFDDSRSADWLACRDLFRRYKAHATFFYSWTLSEDHLEAMKLLQAEGHSIGLHTLHHKDCTFTEKEDLELYFQEEIQPQLELTEKASIRINSFAYPNNRHTAESDQFLSQYFRHARANLTPAPQPSKGYWIADFDQYFFDYEKVRNTWALYGPGIGQYYESTHENLGAALERAAKENKLIVYFSHGIHENAPAIHMDIKTLEFCLEKAASLGMKIVGMDELP